MDGKLDPKLQNLLWEKFKSWCHKALIEGYQNMMLDSLDFSQFEEENLTARLRMEMNSLKWLKEKKIEVFREYPLDDENIWTGKKKAKKAEKIDFAFKNWSQLEVINYFGEAKNLSCKTWIKEIGTTVEASQQRQYYVKTGIESFVHGKYQKLQGFLVGYVVNGTPSEIVPYLNEFILKNNLPPLMGCLENIETLNGHSDCYISTNQTEDRVLILKHFFLQFTR